MSSKSISSWLREKSVQFLRMADDLDTIFDSVDKILFSASNPPTTMWSFDTKDRFNRYREEAKR